jgi:DeoR/GlpR family transcriptional regulator of sugar metabolism
VDERTIRRDVDYLQGLLSSVRGIEVTRGRVYAGRDPYAPGYFADQVDTQKEAKQAIARHVANRLNDNVAVVITAGSTTFYVAREIRRAHVEGCHPRNLIALTNSLPALLELISGGVSTGVVGEVFNPDDRAFQSTELRTNFNPSVAIVGASGVVADPQAGDLKLFSHRAEEAAFMKQLLEPIPEIVVATDSSKVGRRHPWAFTDCRALTGKSVCLVTNEMDSAQRDSLVRLKDAALKNNWRFEFDEVKS